MYTIEAVEETGEAAQAAETAGIQTTAQIHQNAIMEKCSQSAGALRHAEQLVQRTEVVQPGRSQNGRSCPLLPGIESAGAVYEVRTHGSVGRTGQ